MSSLPRAAVIAHPGKVDLAALRGDIAATEAQYGWGPSRWYTTEPGREGDVLTAEALADAPDLVIAAGGDGTVRTVASTLRGTSTPLGIVPAGTGNLLARNLRLDVTSRAACVRAAFTGDDVRIDVGVATVERPSGTREDLVFTVLSGIGVDAGMIANTPAELKQQIGWLAYLAGIAKSVVIGSHFTARLKLGEARASTVHAQTVLFGNCGLMPGGMVLLPDARIDDGLLDVCVVSPRSIFGWFSVWRAVVWQSGLLRHSAFGRKLIAEQRPRRVLRYEQTSSSTFRLAHGAEEFEVDGDAAGEIVAARITLDPESLTVRVPKDVPRAPILKQAAEFGERLRERLASRG